jgi:large subunit ribosomal protein L24
MKKWSSSWKSSKQPRKQRKYVYNAPLHIKRKMMAAHLSKELREKYGIRSFPIRKGDQVIIMRGKFKGTTGKVEKVFTKQMRVGIDTAKITTKSGQKVYAKIRPSSLMIISLDISDKKRLEKLNKLAERNKTIQSQSNAS